MKNVLVLAFTVLVASTAFAASLETVLTADSVVYTIDGSAETPHLQIARRSADTVTALIVPGTEDEAMEADARLAWDSSSSTLFVAWTHRTGDGDEIRLARLDAKGNWSKPLTVASIVGLRRVSLQLVLTRAEIDGPGSPKATLLHTVWWSLIDPAPVAEYALVAFEGGEHVSTQVDTVDALAPAYLATDVVVEATGIALHPPMAIARSASGVEVVYGRGDSTAVRRIAIDPKRIVGNARAWRPVGRSGDVTGRTGLVSANSTPVQAFVSNGRIVLYTPGTQFRYMVFENGQWSRLHMIQLDETLTSEQLVQQLHRNVDELVASEAAPANH